MSAQVNTETVVGGAVIAAAAAFLLYAISATSGGGVTGSGGYKLSAEFDNIEGINIGTDVRLAGIKVGTVSGQGLNPDSYQARLDLLIDNSVSLTEDTTAKIASEGLLGVRFVALEPGGADTKLADGGVISYTQGAVDIWSLISQAMFERAKPSAGEKSSDAPADDAEKPVDGAEPPDAGTQPQPQ
jgi:phospholipid/cholesterol/gamma-HCH transport system substrate-binding protein